MGGRKAQRRARGKWGEEIKARFLARLRETGNARATLRELGHANMFYKRRRRDAAFALEWDDAVAAADARLKGAENAFPEGAGLGSEGGEAAGPLHQPAAGPPPRSGEDLGADKLGGILRPGRKRAQSGPQPVIRRTSNGRVQISLARDGHWTSEIEADFLARVRATGNFNASARAVGFQPASVICRVRKWPAFKRAVDEALEEASITLDYRLVAHAHALLRDPSEPRGEEEEEDVPFDPEKAMRILGFIDRRRTGRTAGRRRSAVPERTFEEAKANILRKIEAIERHREMERKAASEQADPGRSDGNGRDGVADG